MSTWAFFRVFELPETLRPDSIYYVQSVGDETQATQYVVGQDGAARLVGGAGGGGAGTDLGYDAASRLLSSSIGADVTLPLVASGAAGLAPASGGGTVNFLRADGTWAAPGAGAITYADARLANDVELTANNTWYDGPAVTLAAGTWLINITGHYRRNTTGAANVAVRAFGGAAIHAHGETYHASVNGAQVQVSSHGIAVLTGSTTITLQMLTSTGSAAALMKADTQNNPQGNMATRITAIRLA